ncbi:MAG: hypothetical protein OEQ18_01995 [Gammaproteobacteria bacterium]|nr:hypothetical protein [Gammaproteobacteria bacterium]
MKGYCCNELEKRGFPDYIMTQVKKSRSREVYTIRVAPSTVIAERMRKLIPMCAAGAGLALFATAACAGDPNAAKPIVVEHCVKCHEVPGYTPDAGLPSVSAPSFSELAEQSETYTHESLRWFLRSPHWPMTHLILSNSDIEKLISYIESLRSGEDSSFPGRK